MLGSSSLAHLHSSTRIVRSPYIRKRYNGSLANIHETEHKLNKINQDQPLRICVRKRPRSKRELSQRERDGVSVMDDNRTILINETRLLKKACIRGLTHAYLENGLICLILLSVICLRLMMCLIQTM